MALFWCAGFTGTTQAQDEGREAAAPEPVQQHAPADDTTAEPPSAAETAHMTTDAPARTMDEPAAEPATPSPVSDGISRYTAQLRDLEARYGAYDPVLEESLLGLGLAHQMEGNHQQAIEFLLRAAQVDRVNKGLYDAGRIPLLQRLIGSYVAIEDWEAVDDGYANMQQLYARNYNPTDKTLLPGLGQMINWHLYAFEANVTEDPLRHLAVARQMLLQSVAIVETNYGTSSPQLLDALNGVVLTDYYIALAQFRQQEEAAKMNPDPFRNDPLAPASRGWDPYLQPFNEGLGHIERMIAVAEANQPELQWRLLDARVMLADWNLLYRRRNDAEEIYRQVWEQGRTLENGEAWLARKFAEPVALPNFRFSDSARDQALSDGATDRLDRSQHLGQLVLQFDVSSTGQATNIEVVESRPQADTTTLRRAKSQLKETRFRPKHVDGLAVDTTGTISRYFFEAEEEQAAPEEATKPGGSTEPSVAEVRNVD